MNIENLKKELLKWIDEVYYKTIKEEKNKQYETRLKEELNHITRNRYNNKDYCNEENINFDDYVNSLITEKKQKLEEEKKREIRNLIIILKKHIEGLFDVGFKYKNENEIIEYLKEKRKSELRNNHSSHFIKIYEFILDNLLKEVDQKNKKLNDTKEKPQYKPEIFKDTEIELKDTMYVNKIDIFKDHEKRLFEDGYFDKVGKWIKKKNPDLVQFLKILIKENFFLKKNYSEKKQWNTIRKLFEKRYKVNLSKELQPSSRDKIEIKYNYDKTYTDYPFIENSKNN